MRISRTFGFALGMSAAVLSLSACGGGGSSVAPSAVSPALTQSAPRFASSLMRSTVDPRGLRLPAGVTPLVRPGGYSGPGWLSDDASKPGEKVYVADNSANAIEIYKPTGGAPIGAITKGISGPLGLWVTSTGTLYVSNITSNTVTVYPLGKTSPSETLKGTSGPIDVAVAASGTTYVCGFESNAVYVFANGAKTPTKTLSLSFPESTGITADSDALVSHDNANFDGTIEEYGPGGAGGHDLGIVAGPGGGLRVAKNKYILLGDQTNFVVNAYKPGTTTPVFTISTASHNPYKIALNGAESLLYIADPNNGAVVAYSYPKGVAQSTKFTGLSSAYGVALSPAAPY
jgi:hypothetical protein